MEAGEEDVSTLLARATARLDPPTRSEAELLLCHVLDRPRAWLFAHARDPVEREAASRYGKLVARRIAGEPIAQLVGHRGFWSFELRVTPDVLIPRPETELLVERALTVLPADRPLLVADLGTGSGAIALALAKERPFAEVFAVDASAAALEIAATNARATGLESRVRFLHGDWLAPLAGLRFDAIVSNPPYIANDDPHLEQGDLRFEPRAALVSGADGLDAIRAIAGNASANLHGDGWLLLEHGWQQGAVVRAILEKAGFDEIATHRDLEARDRVTVGRRRD